MKTSEIIALLANDIKKHGDRRLMIRPLKRADTDCFYEIILSKRKQYKSDVYTFFNLDFC